jgi:DNA invertase Pin-like site-specific DNA recombinase
MVTAPSVFTAGRAAMYVRMSTEHQQYSTENQADAIGKYATRHNFSVVKTFVDYGKSGLRLSSRPALIELLRQVESGTAQFETILVYDVSRWGRFQDADESAYYEYVCKRAGVIVHYCAEQFENDGSVSSALLKTIKRSMAGEYSRELSVKVFAGQSRLVEMGFRQGGRAGFGLRRQLLDRDGKIKGLLGHGEQKSIQTDRVVLIPGPEEELSIVRDIFALFTGKCMSESGIARRLNEKGILTDRGRAWTRTGIHSLLTNPKYIGTNIFNRKSYKLSKKVVTNPSTMWIRRDNAFEGIVPTVVFAKAQQLVAARAFGLTDEEMLDSLRRLWTEHGRLTAALINQDRSTPCVSAFLKHFKHLTRAYDLIGYKAARYHKYAGARPKLNQQQRDLCSIVTAKLRSYGATVQERGSNNMLLVNGQFTTLVKICYCNETPSGTCWSVHFDRSLHPDVTIAARLKPGNAEILDYYLFPSLDQFTKRVSLTMENEQRLDVYRFDNLDVFLSLARRSLVQTS